LDQTLLRGGKPVGEIVEGNRRFTMQVRFPLEQRGRAYAISNLCIGDNEGHFIPFAQLADIQDEGYGLPNRSDSYFAAGNTNIDTGCEFRFPVNGAGTSIIPRVKSEIELFKILSCHFDRKRSSGFRTRRAA
jgi:hypothetical protein